MSEKQSLKKTRTLGKGLPAELQNRLSSVVAIFVFFMFVVQPLVIGKNRYAGYTTFKLSSFYWIFGVFLVVLAFVTLQYIYTKPAWVTKTWKQRLSSLKVYDYALIIFVLSMFISMLIAVFTRGNIDDPTFHINNMHESYPKNAIWGSADGRSEGFVTMFCYALIIWIVGHWYRPKQWHFMALCIVAGAISIYGILQFYMIDPLNLNFNVGNLIFNEKYQLNSLATISNRDFASTFLCLTVFICFVQFTQHKSLLKWVYFVCLMFVVYTLILMRTLSGFIGIAATGVLLLPLFIHKRAYAYRSFFLIGCCMFVANLAEFFRGKGLDQPVTLFGIGTKIALICLVIAAILFFLPKQKKQLRLLNERTVRISWIVFLVVLIIVFIALLPKLANNSMTGAASTARLQNLFHELYEMIYHGNFSDDFGSQRFYVWKRAMMLIKEHPIFGLGPDCFTLGFKQAFFYESTERYGVFYDKVHNEFLQYWVDSGIFALLSWITFCFSAIWIAIKRASKEPLILAVSATMLCYMVQSFFNLSMPGVAPTCWTMWGILIALIRNKDKACDLDDEIEYEDDEDDIEVSVDSIETTPTV